MRHVWTQLLLALSLLGKVTLAGQSSTGLRTRRVTVPKLPRKRGHNGCEFPKEFPTGCVGRKSSPGILKMPGGPEFEAM
jgi:hypothetical protein